MSQNGYVDLTFGQNDDQLGSTIKRFKAKGGESYRFTLAWWPVKEDGTLDMDTSTPRFKAAIRNYVKDVGYVVNHGPEFTKLIGEEGRAAISTVIIVWPTRDGLLDKEAFGKLQGEVMIWTISKEKYNHLKKIAANGFPFGKFDLSADCTDTQYQKMTFSPCPENLLRNILGAQKAKVKEWGAKLIEKITQAGDRVESELAKNLTIQELKERMSGSSGGNGPVAATGAVGTDDIDGMIDDVLES